ncbi:MAG: Crp/Fnr family transcriptional regulator [Trueperaceae bacterium]|nr:Crp/Fnr family transcriptional regulator [Trueperaceae bacterium]
MPLEPADVLVRCPPFAELGDDDVHALAAIAVWRRFARGAALFHAQDLPEGLHVVASGSCRVFVLDPQTGREIVLTIEHPFLTVAELPSFDGGPYPAYARAIEDTTTLFLPQAAFDRLLLERPRIAVHLLRTLGGRLRRLVALVEQLSFQQVAQRLAAYVLEHAERGLPFALETNGAIAAQLGTVPELVSRNLARLHQAGTIELDARTVARADLAALRSRVEAG